ncbi:hypothetical protein A7985_06185 [Pseudoalteromonas luteoviolacea]|uniref:Metallo-beta-lactamase domain-containing protein n=1 Tax=Pseudoalteromonas luteoviolacea TaxID=43657 RepID=A0A1C0TW24_9GAMM|nr:MBL fold metallo-hydrolase [Pseudoalteromonas luteoviolacea]OCQ23526.1 hypothetical protein A7985_06185 [Pseudoalteromonas luteoviolacea]
MCIFFQFHFAKKQRVISYLLGSVLAFHCHGAAADETVDKIVKRAVEAYGGEALMSLERLQIEEQLYRFSEGQSGFAAHGAHGIQLHKYQQQLQIDYTSKRKVFKRSDQNLIGNYGYYDMTAVDRRFGEGKGYNIDHCLQTIQQTTRISWDSVSLGMEQTVDPLIVKALAESKLQIKHLGTMFIKGRAHNVLGMNKNNIQQTMFFDTSTGLLSRVVHKKDNSKTRFDFLNHTRSSQGIVWAYQTMVSTDQHPNKHVTSRKLTADLANDSLTLIPEKYKPKRSFNFLDFAKPSVKQVAEGVFLVGQDWGFTLFADIGESYVSMGSWQMPNDVFSWKQRLAHLHQFTGGDKPVSHFIVTHHHDDHLIGLQDVIEHGAQLLLLPEHVEAVRTSHSAISPENLTFIQDAMQLANGKIQVFDVPSSHADHNLVVYLAEYKVLFAEDMFGSSFEHGFHSPNSWPSRDVYYRSETLEQKVHSVGIDVQKYVSSHHGRVLSNADFKQALKLVCPPNSELENRLFKE